MEEKWHAICIEINAKFGAPSTESKYILHNFLNPIFLEINVTGSQLTSVIYQQDAILSFTTDYFTFMSIYRCYEVSNNRYIGTYKLKAEQA